MTEREQLLLLCRRNRWLARENRGLQEELSCIEREAGELRVANANLRVERDAADVLLGTAMDEVLSRRSP